MTRTTKRFPDIGRPRSSLTALLVLLAGGCANTYGATQEAHEAREAREAREAQQALAEGEVRLSEEAQHFVRSEPLTPVQGVTALRAPARVAFRDGAIAAVGSPVAGNVATVHVRVGQSVREGEPLLTLRSPDAAASRAQLAAARAALEGALAEARRSAEMLEQGVSTERERRQSELRVAELEIELARARVAVSIMGRGQGGEVVLRAPIAGTVLSHRAALGMVVEPGSEPLMEIGDPTGIGVIAEVFDRDAAMVRVGARVEVSLPSIDAPLRGQVAYLAPVVSSGTRTVPVRVELDEISPLLRAGLFGRASIALVDEGLVLPSTAVLVRDGQRTIVYVDAGQGIYRRRDVTVGPSVDGHVHVLAGLEAGERVVVEGALLIDGAADLLI